MAKSGVEVVAHHEVDHLLAEPITLGVRGRPGQLAADLGNLLDVPAHKSPRLRPSLRIRRLLVTALGECPGAGNRQRGQNGQHSGATRD